MNSSLTKIVRQREYLSQQLSSIRQASLKATRSDDFRTVARLTLEAARVNNTLAEIEAASDMAR